MIWIFPILILSIVVLWGYFSSSIILYTPREALEANPKTFGYEFNSFQLNSSDGVKLEAWWVPCKKLSAVTIVVLHGWGANRSDVLRSTIHLADHFNLAYLDFRNHGISGDGKTSLTCLEMRDFKACVKFLKSEKKSFSERIGVFGFSMGGAVAISGSAQMPEIAAVVAESPFASYRDTVYRYARMFYFAPKFAVPITLAFARWRLGFDPEGCSPIYHIAQLAPRPILIIQSSGDERMPTTEGQQLFNAAQEPKEIWTVPGADHGDIAAKNPEEYKTKILNFFKKYL